MSISNEEGQLHQKLNVREQFEAILRCTQRAAEALRQALWDVPLVEEYGHCYGYGPHAEQLYSQKAEREHEAQCALSKAHEMKKVIEEEVHKALERVGRLEADAQRLHGERVRSEMSKAVLEARSLHEKVVGQEEKLTVAIEDLANALSESHRKAGRFGKPSSRVPGLPAVNVPQPGGPAFEDQARDLLPKPSLPSFQSRAQDLLPEKSTDIAYRVPSISRKGW